MKAMVFASMVVLVCLIIPRIILHHLSQLGPSQTLHWVTTLQLQEGTEWLDARMKFRLQAGIEYGHVALIRQLLQKFCIQPPSPLSTSKDVAFYFYLAYESFIFLPLRLGSCRLLCIEQNPLASIGGAVLYMNFA